MIKFINGSYAHGLSCGGNRVRKIPTRISVSSGRFFSLDEKSGHTVSPECTDLHQTNYGV